MEDVFVGIDPDIRNVTYVVVNSEGKPLLLCLSKMPKVPGMSALETLSLLLDAYLPLHPPNWRLNIAVELPQVGRYTVQRGAKPQDIANLCYASGIIASKVSCLNDMNTIRCISPQKWKGSIAKDVHQKFIAKRTGIPFKESSSGNYPVPLRPEDLNIRVMGTTPSGKHKAKLNESDWIDLYDSWGLALWAKDNIKTT